MRKGSASFGAYEVRYWRWLLVIKYKSHPHVKLWHASTAWSLGFHHQSTLDAVYVYAVPWSEFRIVPSYPPYAHGGARGGVD